MKPRFRSEDLFLSTSAFSYSVISFYAVMALMRPLVLHTFKLPSVLSLRRESSHVFKEVIPWKNSKALADYLSKNVLFNERKFRECISMHLRIFVYDIFMSFVSSGGLVVVNKPYGVCSSSKSNSKQYSNAAPVGDQVFNLYDALPYLAQKIGFDELFVGYVPER